ncbi:MAG: hypothetical protein H8E10_20030 [Desulfobacterales bacterium]|nr:hypothetical protein [Desulfobacterales bacterium]
MREIFFQKIGLANILKSPWLRTEEAAKYCGMSLEVFEEHSEGLPHGGDSELKLFHVSSLDVWMEDNLEIPFPHETAKRPRQEIFRQKVDNLRELDQEG